MAGKCLNISDLSEMSEPLLRQRHFVSAPGLINVSVESPRL